MTHKLAAAQSHDGVIVAAALAAAVVLAAAGGAVTLAAETEAATTAAAEAVAAVAEAEAAAATLSVLAMASVAAATAAAAGCCLTNKPNNFDGDQEEALALPASAGGVRSIINEDNNTDDVLIQRVVADILWVGRHFPPGRSFIPM